MCSSSKAPRTSPSSETHLVELIGTFPAEVMLAGQNDHGFAEDLLTEGTDEMFVQHRDGWASLCSSTATAASVLLAGHFHCCANLPRILFAGKIHITVDSQATNSSLSFPALNRPITSSKLLRFKLSFSGALF